MPLRKFLAVENPLKMTKNASFMLKLFSFLKYFHFCTDFLVIKENGLITKATFNFKIYDVTDWQTNNYNKRCLISQGVKVIKQ